MNHEKTKLDIGSIEDITVYLVRIAERMQFIDDVYDEFKAGNMDTVMEETIREAAQNSLGDVHYAFQTLDENTNVRSYMDDHEFEWAFPKEVHYGRQAQRKEAR